MLVCPRVIPINSIISLFLLVKSPLITIKPLIPLVYQHFWDATGHVACCMVESWDDHLAHLVDQVSPPASLALWFSGISKICYLWYSYIFSKSDIMWHVMLFCSKSRDLKRFQFPLIPARRWWLHPARFSRSCWCCKTWCRAVCLRRGNDDWRIPVDTISGITIW